MDLYDLQKYPDLIIRPILDRFVRLTKNIQIQWSGQADT